MVSRRASRDLRASDVTRRRRASAPPVAVGAAGAALPGSSTMTAARRLTSDWAPRARARGAPGAGRRPGAPAPPRARANPHPPGPRTRTQCSLRLHPLALCLHTFQHNTKWNTGKAGSIPRCLSHLTKII